ncbi:hypothetical protein DV737_g2281, partial [Chaetothyriales sp. CBS 132003]
MARINIPFDVITSRLNLQDRLNSVSSQSMATRFANLKPVSEFLDLKRLSKPNNFAEIQTRVNYNLAYFSSNYAVVFVMLAIYSLITNPWLLFDIVFVVFGMWFIGKLKGGDLAIGTIRATTSQLYTGLLCISVPIAFFSGPFATLLWLIGASGVTILERSGYSPPQPQPPAAVPAKSSPKGKQAATAPGKSKQKKAEVKKASAKKDTSSSSSPRLKPVEATRARRKSTASSRSKNDNRSDVIVPYPLPPEDRAYPAAYYARRSAPPSRQNSGDPSMQGWPAQPQYLTYPHPYYAHPQSRYVSYPGMVKAVSLASIPRILALHLPLHQDACLGSPARNHAGSRMGCFDQKVRRPR